MCTECAPFRMTHRAPCARFLNAPPPTLSSGCGKPYLHLSSLRTLAIETFKIAYGLSPQYLNEFICFKKSTLYNFRYSHLPEIARTKSTRYGTNSFRYQAAKLWNSLPELPDDRKVTSLNDFKLFIKSWNGASYAGKFKTSSLGIGLFKSILFVQSFYTRSCWSDFFYI